VAAAAYGAVCVTGDEHFATWLQLGFGGLYVCVGSSGFRVLQEFHIKSNSGCRRFVEWALAFDVLNGNAASLYRVDVSRQECRKHRHFHSANQNRIKKIILKRF
jgi:hypothetical protein